LALPQRERKDSRPAAFIVDGEALLSRSISRRQGNTESLECRGDLLLSPLPDVTAPPQQRLGAGVVHHGSRTRRSHRLDVPGTAALVVITAVPVATPIEVTVPPARSWCG
jgi:hypothetical protein